jgi:Domain of unknown function (DUF4279)
MNAEDRTPLRTVSASLSLVGYGMRPAELTATLGVEPSSTDLSHLPARFSSSGVAGGRECGLWSYDTAVVVSGSDLGDHIRHLIRLFRPLWSRIEEFDPPVRAFIHLRCRATSRIGAGPVLSPRIEPDCVAGIARLGAVLTFELFTGE